MNRLIPSLALLCVPVVLPAQPLVLDLPATLERALSTDQRITEKEKLVDAARALLQEAEGSEGWLFDANTFLGLAPKIKGGVFESTDGSGNRVINIPDDAYDWNGVSPWYYLSFSVVKPLNTFGKVEHYSRAASNNITIKQGDVAIQRSRTLLDVTRAYHGYLAARDTRLLLEDAAGNFDGAISLVEDWLADDEGKAKQSDLYALQTGAALLRRYIAEAASLENIALAALRLLAGVDAGTELQLADKHLVPVPLPQGELAVFQARALEQRPEVSQLNAGLEARRALVLAKKSEAKPNLYAGVVGALSYAPAREDVLDAAVYDPFRSGGATPVIGLKWDWASGRQPAQVAQAQAELESTMALKAFAQQGIPFEVEEQYRTVHARHEMVRNLEDASRASRRWMTSAYLDFEAGAEEAEKVITAMLSYVQSYSDYLKTTHDYNLQVARLQVVTGEFQ